MSPSSRKPFRLIGALLLVAVLAVIIGVALYSRLRFRQQPSPPYHPEDALKTIQIDQGFHLELFAAEPMIMSPVAMDWDENGRIYLAEDTGYPL